MPDHPLPGHLLPHPRQRPTLPLGEALSWAGIGRTAGYAAAREYERTGGASGFPAIRVGRRLVVPTAELWRMVGLDPDRQVA